ncbi:hypothetical protein FQA39_LY07206 [Lamprigera yunnana]|nr:hypothetical protein FQA39_LY07206 [Lamprigera yunnana]
MFKRKLGKAKLGIGKFSASATWLMSRIDGEITDGERRKRMNTENDSEEDNAFLKSKKLSRTLMKLKQKNEDKLERVLEILQQLTQDVNQIKLKQIRSNTELIELKVRNENLRMENKNTKKENSKIVKEIQEINTRVEQLEKEKRTNNIVIQDLMLKENNTQKLKEDTEKFLNEKRDMNIRVERVHKIRTKTCLVELESFDVKREVMKNKVKLRNIREENTFIINDLTKQDREIDAREKK